MTLTELVEKLDTLIKDNLNKNNDITKSKIYFYAEDDYNTIDLEIDNIEIEDNKIFIS
jgi:hypothetical protein|tara:strand:+ start:472 stop:645 length:174 start_codon:yes stop_codon:yes gene_type:complete